MANNEETSTTLKRSWFQELKGEFKKITWLNKASLAKQSVVVIIVTIILGALIAVLDYLIKYGLSFIVG